MSDIVIKLIIILIYALFLYIVAFTSHRGHEEDDDILGLSRTQWEAFFLMLLPSMALFLR